MLGKALKALTIVIVCFCALGVSTAKGHLVSQPKNKTTEARYATQTHNLRHARYVCNNGSWLYVTTPWHCSWVHILLTERKETYLKLHPPEVRYAIKYLSAWTCIHGGEGAWNANTGNGYYGGLQMDYGFMSTYGGELLRTKGTANNWTPYEQMVVAERAHDSGRGFYPWPNTARRCGLI